jgi:heme-degrading monooxygenase HmoA
MKRRTCLSTLLAGAAALAPAAESEKPIELHVDLAVDPSKEQEMLNNFHKIFRPAAMKQPGFIDVQMLKLRSALDGNAPAGANYRFVLVYKSEELRKQWVATPTHQKVWPTIERTLKSTKYNVLLYDRA